MDLLLVLTATIDPSSGSANLKINDPLVRLSQYQHSLQFWLRHPDPRLRSILFLENSNYPLDTLKATPNPLSKEVEFLSFRENNCPPHLDYGYAELDMIDRALQESRLMGQSRYFIKTTGRLTFPQLPRLLDRLPPSYNFAVDCRIPFWTGQPTVSPMLMIFSVDFYRKELFNVKSKMNDVFRGMETLFYYKLMDHPHDAVLRWPVNCEPVGYDATFGKSYNSGRRRAGAIIRSVARACIPKMWI